MVICRCYLMDLAVRVQNPSSRGDISGTREFIEIWMIRAGVFRFKKIADKFRTFCFSWGLVIMMVLLGSGTRIRRRLNELRLKKNKRLTMD